MRNQPLLVSVVIGIIVIFVIVGASLVAKLGNETKKYNTEYSKRLKLENLNQQLASDVNSLKKDNESLLKSKKMFEEVIIGLKSDLELANIEIEKLNKIKDVFEEKLKDELMKNESSQ